MAENPYQTAPTNTATKESGFDWSTALDWITKLYGTYSATKPGQFKQVPEDPSLAALRARVLGFIDKSPTRDMFGQMVGQRLEQNNKNPYQLPPAKYGYTPYANDKGPQYDLSKILPTLYGNSNPSAPAAAKPPTTPVGSGTGGAGSLNPGDPGFGQTPNGPGMGLQDIPNLNPTDWAKLKDLYNQYGKDAGSFITAAMSGNIVGMTIAAAKGIWDAFHGGQSGAHPFDPLATARDANPNQTQGQNQAPPRENWTPVSPAEQTGRDFIQNQNDRLGGDGGYSQGGYGGGGNPWFDGIGRPLY